MLDTATKLVPPFRYGWEDPRNQAENDAANFSRGESAWRI